MRTLELVGIRVGFFDLVHGAVGAEMQRDREFVFATVVNPLIIRLRGRLAAVLLDLDLGVTFLDDVRPAIEGITERSRRSQNQSGQ